MLNKLPIGFALLTLLLAASAHAGDVGVEVVFSDREARLIRAWYTSHSGYEGGSKVRGKERKALPPGIARNLVRGKSLPPGIAKQALPTGLVEILPPPPKGYERLEVDGRVLLVEVATRVIHDILEEIVLR